MDYFKEQSASLKVSTDNQPSGTWLKDIASFLMENREGITIDNVTIEQLETHFHERKENI